MDGGRPITLPQGLNPDRQEHHPTRLAPNLRSEWFVRPIPNPSEDEFPQPPISHVHGPSSCTRLHSCTGFWDSMDSDETSSFER